MFYCGIDIGIKNLALCLVDDTVIKEWVVVNLFVPSVCNGTLKSGEKCCKKATFRNKDDFYCGTHKDINCKKYKQKLTTQYSIDDVLKAAFAKLDEYSEYFNMTDIVIIEQQVKANPRMRVLSNAIHAYFLLKYNNIQKIVYSPAKNKLKVCKENVQTTPGGKQLKKIAIQHIIKLLPDEILQQYFYTETKKDDLADAYLHYRFYYDKHN